MLGLYRDHHEGFTEKHFHDLAEKRHGYLADAPSGSDTTMEDLKSGKLSIYTP